MIFTVTLLLTLVIIGLYLAPKVKNETLKGSHFFVAGTVLVVGIVVAAMQPLNVERVDAGHVGIKVYLSGDKRGVSKYEYKTGWVVFNSWNSKLYEFPTYQQHIEYPAQQVITKGGFPATIKPSFNYSLKPGDVGDMFQNLRVDMKQLEQQWLQTAIVGTVNDVANKWSVDDIFNQREKFESDIVVEINKRTKKWFIISQLRTNIVPPEALQSAIVAKTEAIQKVQVAENQKLVAIAEGDRKIAQAKADSAANVIEAAGLAEVMRKKQVNLTPLYVEYLKVQAWDGKMPSTILGGNAGTMINLK